MAATQKAATTRKSKAQVAKDANSVKVNLERPTKDQHVITDEQRQADRRADDKVKTDAMAQFVEQQNASESKPNLAEFNAKMEKLKAEYGVTAEVKVKPAKADKKQMNGITAPGASTTCGKIWSTADAISQAQHGVCSIAALKEHPEMKSINEATLKTQYARWRQYHGVTGRLPKIHAVHQREGVYPGIPTLEESAVKPTPPTAE
jgi:hypothetical protein